MYCKVLSLVSIMKMLAFKGKFEILKQIYIMAGPCMFALSRSLLKMCYIFWLFFYCVIFYNFPWNILLTVKYVCVYIKESN